MVLTLIVLILFAGLVTLATQSYWTHASLHTRLPFGMESESYEAARFRADLRAARDHQQALESLRGGDAHDTARERARA
ncbi:MAG TPA: hypothetical protein VFE65_33410 [Pseudonocardia sp.]|jgi:hypothetical protein|nr:hypothetical protein [Pseudonocardia sp.]